MVVLKGACRNYDALWYCLARCRDVGSDYNIFFFCSVLLRTHTGLRCASKLIVAKLCKHVGCAAHLIKRGEQAWLP